MKTKIYDYDEVLQKDDKSYVKKIRVQDCRDKLNDYHKNGYPLGESSGIKKLDDNFRWRYGFLYCFSGYPQSGKSEILNWLMVLRAKLNGDKICMYSPEIDIHEHITNLARAYLGKNVDIAFPDKCTNEEWESALDFIDEHFIFLENGSEMPSITKLINAFEELAKEGYTAFTIDPLNWVYEGTQNDNIYSYLKLTLTSLKQFAKLHEVFMIYVEHPKTPAIQAKTGKVPKATAYSLAGGTMHFNKCDVMVVMHKLDEDDVENLVANGEILKKVLDNKENNIKFVQFESVKIKSQRINGTTGKVILKYNLITSRYI
tara:strand:+ start:100 stop:1047 length:948 start_codon:yes stop_codon:yes gene_type:complete